MNRHCISFPGAPTVDYNCETSYLELFDVTPTGGQQILVSRYCLTVNQFASRNFFVPVVMCGSVCRIGFNHTWGCPTWQIFGSLLRLTAPVSSRPTSVHTEGYIDTTIFYNFKQENELDTTLVFNTRF